MKALILAGGRGTRISEESQSRPKPMVEIGGRPILWHIMKIYGAAGITEFIVLLGYRGYMIKEYFANYFMHTSDVTIDLANGTTTDVASNPEPWKVTLLDTGADTMTGGRLLRVQRPSATRLLLHLRRRRADVDIRKVVASTGRIGHDRDRHGGATARPLSERIDDTPAGARSRRSRRARRLGERWVLRRDATGASTTSTVTAPCSSRAPLNRLSADRRTVGVSPSRLLASAWTRSGTRST